MITLGLLIGIAAAGLMLVMLLWSILYPRYRIWPPGKPSAVLKVWVWALTLCIFGSALYLGVSDWNSLGWSSPLRWLFGLPLIALGNIAVWLGVAQIGMGATSGEPTGLQTGGLYRYSRNPQYVADMGILIGWAILSASVWTLPVVVLGVVALAVAPFTEESWLVDTYGEEYVAYRSTAPRYL